MVQSVLKLPHWFENEDGDADCVVVDDRGAGDGISGFPDSDFDEFSSQESDGDCSSNSVVELCEGDNKTASATTITATNQLEFGASQAATPSVGKCRALYSYAANMYDELSIQPGDVINIHDKQADGWWLGEFDGSVGIFPATYVEEI